MNQSQSSEAQITNRLLDPGERAACEQLVSGEAPHNQRAQALLALDQGATQREAGQVAGLSQGQVKYWLGKFRKIGMSIFPEDVLEAAQPTADVSVTAEPAGDAEEIAKRSGKKKTGKKSAKKRVKKKKAKKGQGKKRKKKAKKRKAKKTKPKKKDKKAAAGKKSAKKKKKKKA